MTTQRREARRENRALEGAVLEAREAIAQTQLRAGQRGVDNRSHLSHAQVLHKALLPPGRVSIAPLRCSCACHATIGDSKGTQSVTS